VGGEGRRSGHPPAHPDSGIAHGRRPLRRRGPAWATSAELVYGPIAAELIALSPHPLAGRTLLDAGAGTPGPGRPACQAAWYHHQRTPLARDTEIAPA
jgi:hypothetical protein